MISIARRREHIDIVQTHAFYPTMAGLLAATLARTRNYREACGMFCVSGILFNHESPCRGFEFVIEFSFIAYALPPHWNLWNGYGFAGWNVAGSRS